MMRFAKSWVVAVSVLAMGAAGARGEETGSTFMLADQPATAPARREVPYKGGRGLVTLQGMSGMFLNPTSGTLDQGQLTAQYCLLMAEYETDIVGHGVMVDYGITDWLDVGVFGTIVFVDIEGLDDEFAAIGPFIRARILKDEGAAPEVAVGFILLEGGNEEVLSQGKVEIFAAASKGFELDRDGFFRSIRGHVGIRYGTQGDRPGDPEFGYFYGGLELEFPYSIYLIGELSTDNWEEDGADEERPYAIGVQWKPNGVVGISIAHMRPDGFEDPGFWFGVGLTFKL